MADAAKAVRFSQHALEKFDLLAKRGFVVTSEAVVETVLKPDRVDADQYPPIAQRALSENTLLRVVYLEMADHYLIVTFYPGERKRYEG